MLKEFTVNIISCIIKKILTDDIELIKKKPNKYRFKYLSESID